jgi:hypothetical protein
MRRAPPFLPLACKDYSLHREISLAPDARAGIERSGAVASILQPSAILLDEEITMRIGSAVAVLLAAACLQAAPADAAGCREELQQLEDRLNESSLAADEPETFAELARAVEDAAELRDEQLCLRRAAELNAAVAAAEPEPVEAARAPANPPRANRAPPKPPVLLQAAPAGYDDAEDEDLGDAGPAEGTNPRDQDG